MQFSSKSKIFSPSRQFIIGVVLSVLQKKFIFSNTKTATKSNLRS